MDDIRLKFADQLTLDRIACSHPDIKEELREMYLHANFYLLGNGVRLRFSWVWRWDYEQENLFRQKPKVTDARAWQSIHNYGLAFDIVLLYDNDGNGTFEEASWDTVRDGDKNGISDWYAVSKYFEYMGYENGFIKRGRKWDFPHFQKDFGYKWRALKALIDSGKYKSEIINGKEYKYPILNN